MNFHARRVTLPAITPLCLQKRVGILHGFSLYYLFGMHAFFLFISESQLSIWEIVVNLTFVSDYAGSGYVKAFCV